VGIVGGRAEEQDEEGRGEEKRRGEEERLLKRAAEKHQAVVVIAAATPALGFFCLPLRGHLRLGLNLPPVRPPQKITNCQLRRALAVASKKIKQFP
jgi:hypothetical protein